MQSPIAPPKERFIATMYYAEAFNMSPYTKTKQEEVIERLILREMLVRIAREKRDRIYRLTAIGKARIGVFKSKLDQLHALHISNQHFDSDSFEFYYLNAETQKLYLGVCRTLQKIIFLCNRLVRQSQFDVLSGLFVELGALILIFKIVHSARGSNESIEFLDNWFEQVNLLVLMYVASDRDYHKLERLYFITAHLGLKDREKLDHPKKLILSALPESEDLLLFIEKKVKELNNERDFYDLSVEEQKEFFIDMAKKLGNGP